MRKTTVSTITTLILVLAGIALLATGCKKEGEHHPARGKDAVVRIRVQDEKGNSLGGIPILIYDETGYEKFEKNRNTPPTDRTVTQADGEIVYRLPYDKWLKKGNRFLSFVIYERLDDDNYRIWAASRTIVAGKEERIDFELEMTRREKPLMGTPLDLYDENNGRTLFAQALYLDAEHRFAGANRYSMVDVGPVSGVEELGELRLDGFTDRTDAQLRHGYFICKDKEEGFQFANTMLELGGLGHSAVIHTGDMEIADEYGVRMKVGRIIVNSPSSQGAIGDIYNTNTPSLTLGCGSYGKNSVSQNVTTVNLVNKKRIAKRRVNMQWFKVPPKIYFENDSIQYLEKMEDISRAFIVTDPVMVKLGNVDKVLYYLRKREQYCHSEIYSDVESDPSVECIMRGVEAMRVFQPDVIIAIGGGSAIDAAKGMWLFYEHPETSFDGLRQRFLDIRKRAFKFPKLGTKTKLVAIPTTSGTGSEVTSFSVITDKSNGNIKYPLADYSLTPDVAIIDPQFTRTMPRSIVADTGLDVLTHAIEAYVSVMASDYTDGLALQAAEMVFTYLERSYNGDPLAREKMHNASCIAGMAFTNAFLGLNHSMAHKLGGEFHIPHGRANAILMPYVIAYNAKRPTKFAAFPKYKEYVADQRYAKLAQRCGLCNIGTGTYEAVDCLIAAIQKLMLDTERPLTIKACGISEEEFLAKVDELSYKAFEDQCTTANPVYPLVSEIKELYLQAYYGK